MFTRIVAIALVLGLPLAAQAADRTFYCTGGSAGKPQANVELRKLDGQEKGTIKTADMELAASVYDTTNGFTFIVTGSDFAINYTVNVETGYLDYSGSGSKAGFAQGACAEG